MATLPGKAVSLWVDTGPSKTFPKQSRDVTVDVAVLGGGIVGLTAALLLKRAGQTVAVAEASQVAGGVSGHTTGKLSSLHNVIYKDIVKSFGKRGAGIYGQANQAAIEQVEELIAQEKIDCDWHRADNYSYAETDEAAESLRQEAETAASLGLPASYVTETPLPFAVKGAVKMTGQAYFHSVKYVSGLAAKVAGGGSYVFENTRALDATDGSKDGRKPCTVKTEHGTITAANVIVATHIPFLDRGLWFARVHPHRSYLIAVRLKGALPNGMYIGTPAPGTAGGYGSTRSIMPYDGGDRRFLLIGGEGHKTGQGGDTTERYQRLVDYAKERFDVASVAYRWASQDNMPLDGLPYVGKYTPFSKRIYVATGFRKWGLAAGTAAGMVLSDRVLGQQNAWAATFDSNRFKPFASAGNFIGENFNTGIRYITDRFSLMGPGGRGGGIESLGTGQGKVLTAGGQKVAAYRDDAGALHTVDPVCTHLQCLVDFNDADKTWDCPCHGSRFTTDGAVLQGPATKPLERKKV